VITDLSLTIPVAEVRRLLGYPPGYAIPERVQSLLATLLAETSSLVEPRGTFERFALSDAVAVQLPLPGAENSLSGFALGLVTIGPRLEERATAALSAGDATEALLLDAIGSAAVEAAADSLGSLISLMGGHDAARGGEDRDGLEDRGKWTAPGGDEAGGVDDGRGTACRISPGYGGWPLAAQEAIFAKLPHDAIGVQLWPSMLMVPRKSVTFALWFDPVGRALAGGGGCSRFELEPCPRRASAQRGDPT
jgi:cobalamin-dependent methionine synthase I